jgi:hypothetical protein
MHWHPLSRKTTLILAAAGVALVALLSYAAVSNAHAHASQVPATQSSHATIGKSSQSTVSAVPSAISQTQSASGDSSTDDPDSTMQTSTSQSATSAQPEPSLPPHNKPLGIKAAYPNIPDPDTYKPPFVAPPTGPLPPPHPICNYREFMPADTMPKCDYPYPFPPCHPQQPGAMIACPIAYKAE